VIEEGRPEEGDEEEGIQCGAGLRN